jgi:hypothetical protein
VQRFADARKIRDRAASTSKVWDGGSRVVVDDKGFSLFEKRV